LLDGGLLSAGTVIGFATLPALLLVL